MNVLVYLAERAGEAVTHEELLAEFWRGAISLPNAVHKCIAELRHIFGNGGGEPAYIETIPKRGYRLVVPVSRVETPMGARYTKNGARAEADLVTKAIEKPRSIAVLRFRSVGNADHEYLAQGIADALRTGLAHVRRLTVADSERSVRHSIADATAQQIGAELDVTHVLDGSVQSFGDRIRVVVSLYEVAGDEPRHVYTHDEPIDRILQVHDKTVADVLSELDVQLDDVKAAEMRDWGTRNVQAYLAAAEGQYFLQHAEMRSLRFAASRLRDAIALDPGFCAAYAILADTLGDIGMRTGDEDAQNAFRKEIASLRETVSRIDPTSAEIKTIQWNETRLGTGNFWAQIEAQARAEIQAAGPPAAADYNYVRYADYLISGRLFREAGQFLDVYEKFEPENAWVGMRRSTIATITQGPRRGIPLVEATVRLFPHDPLVMHGLPLLYALVGEFDTAERYLQRVREIDPVGGYTSSAALYLSVLRGDVRPGSEEFHLATRGSGLGPLAAGLAYLLVGDIDSGLSVWRRTPPGLRELHYRTAINAEGYVSKAVVHDPRFQDYLDERGLGQKWTAFLREKVAELTPVTGIVPGDPTPQRAFQTR